MKLFKRLVSAFMSFSMCLICLPTQGIQEYIPAVTVQAEDSYQVLWDIQDGVIAKPGETVTVKVMIEGDTTLNAFKATVKPNENLTYRGFKSGTAYGSGWLSIRDNAANAAEIKFTGSLTDSAISMRYPDINGSDGVIMTLSFAVPAKKADGSEFENGEKLPIAWDESAFEISRSDGAVITPMLADGYVILEVDESINYEYSIVLDDESTDRFFFAHDPRPLDLSAMGGKLYRQAVRTDGTKVGEPVELMLNTVDVDLSAYSLTDKNGEALTNPKAIYESVADKQDQAYCWLPLQAKVHEILPDGTEIDQTLTPDSEIPFNANVFIGVKGDTDLNGACNAVDAALVLGFAAECGASADPRTVKISDNNKLENFVYFLSDVNGESEDHGTTSNTSMAGDASLNASDALLQLTYAAFRGAGTTGTCDWATQVIGRIQTTIPKYTNDIYEWEITQIGNKSAIRTVNKQQTPPAFMLAKSTIGNGKLLKAGAMSNDYTDGGTFNISIDQKEINIQDIADPVPIYVRTSGAVQGINALEIGVKVDEGCDYTPIIDSKQAAKLGGESLNVKMTVGDSKNKDFYWFTWADNKPKSEKQNLLLCMVNVPSTAEVGDTFDIVIDSTSGSSPILLVNTDSRVSYTENVTNGRITIVGQPTEPPTEPATEPPTEPQTDPTEPPTNEPTDPPTEPITDPTEPPTHAITEPPLILASTSITLSFGEQYTIEANKSGLTYSSSNTKVAIVSPDGVVTGLSGGTATITVFDEQYHTAQLTVNVLEPTEPMTDPIEPPTEPEKELPLGDVNDDKSVNASDAAQILIAAASIGAGKDSGLTNAQTTAADANGDKIVNASDAALVLVYAAYVGAGGSMSFPDYLVSPPQPATDPTEPPTEKPTQAPTQPPTEKPTQAPTQPPTERPTQPLPTEPPTDPPIDSGNCGNSTKWKLYDWGELVIEGKGAMYNYHAYDERPWEVYEQYIWSITVEEGVTAIGDYAFQYCSQATSVSIPSTVTSIGDFAFAECSSIEKIYIPKSVTSIKDYTFYYCGDQSYNGYLTLSGYSTSYAKKYADSHGIPFLSVDTGSCGKNATFKLDSTGSLTISGTGTMYEDFYSFAWYDARTDIKTVVIKNGITNIGRTAFANCSSLTNVSIPSSVSTIGPSAFGACVSLTSVTIPSSVTVIDSQAFRRCHKLSSITILNKKCQIYDEARTISTAEYVLGSGEHFFNGVIRGYSGSTAEAYAKKYGYSFEPISS